MKLNITLCDTWEEVLSLDARGEAQLGGFGCYDMPDSWGLGGIINDPTEIAGLLVTLAEYAAPGDDGDQVVLNYPMSDGTNKYLFITGDVE